MAIYFTSKSRLITKAVNLYPLTNKWLSMKRTVYTTSSVVKLQQQQYSSNLNQPLKQPPGSDQQQQQQQGEDKRGNKSGGGRFKGKIHKIRKVPKEWWTSAGAGWTILSVLDWWLLVAGGWLSWQGVILRWTPLGICLAAAIQWHLHNRELDRKGLPRTATKWQTSVYCSLPLRLFSRGWGWMADLRVPIPLRPVVYGTYSRSFGVNLTEAQDQELKNYRSISEFFTRSLKPDCRTIDSSCIVSPADGKVLYFGLANNAHIEQVKGVSYSLESFIGESPKLSFNSVTAAGRDNNNNDMQIATTNDQQLSEAKKHHNYVDSIKKNKSDLETALYQCVIYLAPGDYHRFHSPTTWKPQVRRHFAGELLSVSPRIAQWLPGLFCLNERALYMGEWEHGFFSLTAVGATNVGSVQIYIDDELKTNRWIGLQVGRNKRLDYAERNLPSETKLEKGQLLGQFNMGSTIVLVFEAPKSFKFTIEPGQKIMMGQQIGCLES